MNILLNVLKDGAEIYWPDGFGLEAESEIIVTLDGRVVSAYPLTEKGLSDALGDIGKLIPLTT